MCSRGHTRNLDQLMNSLISQEVPKGWFFHSVTFVWNGEARPQSLNLEQGIQRKGQRTIVREFTETKKGIPYARNRALEIARNDGLTHVVFIDDDCLPSPNWLEELLTVVDETGAGVVAGGWRISAARDASTWLPNKVFGTKHYYFLGKKAGGRDELPTAYTRNVAFATSLLDQVPHKYRVFPESMASTGGSDSVFFARAHASGARIIYAPDAQVDEKYDSSRLTLKWHFFRRLRNTQVRLRRRQETREPLAEPKVAIATLALALFGLPAIVLTLPLAFFLTRARRTVGSTLLYVAPLFGALLWGLRVEYQEYSNGFRFRSRRTSREIL